MNFEPNAVAATPAEFVPLAASFALTVAPLVGCLLGAATFAILRSSLQRTHPPRVLAEEPDPKRRARLEPLLENADRLATSAIAFEIACRAAFAVLLARALAGAQPMGYEHVLAAALISIPTLIVVCEALPSALALRQGDALVRRTVIAFHVFQLPVRFFAAAFDLGRSALLRLFGHASDPAASRQIVEGLREVIEESEIRRDLDETEREIIGNVIEFRDVSVSAVMTPRTEVKGVDMLASLRQAAHALTESGHSRLPVYDQSLDAVLGFITARDVVEAAAGAGFDGTPLKNLLRPALFVPETKTVSELLAEFRREKIKLAIVLDEYGGTAGLVTLGDVIREIVGEIDDEFEEESVPQVRRLENGAAEVDATLHVSDVNEELELEIPEAEEYETLAGYVLSELGRFPEQGETFTAGNLEYTVVEASDRRVLRVRIKPLSTVGR